MTPSARLRLGSLGVIVATAAMALAGAQHAVAQSRTLEIDDFRLEIGVSSPVLSPDGRRAVIQTSTPNYEENRFDRRLVLVDIETGDQRGLTPHRHAVAAPRFSPTGADSTGMSV